MFESTGNLVMSKTDKRLCSHEGELWNDYSLCVTEQAFLKHFKFNFVYKTLVYTQPFRNKFSEEMRGIVIIR